MSVEISGINPSDAKSCAKRLFDTDRVVPHSDGAGTIDAVGDGVTSDRIGQQVWLWNAQWRRAMGSAARWVCLPSVQVVALSEGVALEAGAVWASRFST